MNRIIIFMEEAYANITLPLTLPDTEILFLVSIDEIPCSETFLHSVIALVTNLNISTSKILMQNFPRLRAIATPTTGHSHIDESYCSENNIQIISLRDEKLFLQSISTTAEHAWSLFLLLNRNLLDSIGRVKETSLWLRDSLNQRQLRGDTVGIIGYGRLGRFIADYSLAFGMDVSIYDLYKINKPTNIMQHESVHELIKHIDHLFLTASYYNGDPPIITAANCGDLDLLTLVNVSRGELIDEDFIVSELESGRLKSFAADVLNGDSGQCGPICNTVLINSPILSYSRNHGNVVVTPHCAGYATNVLSQTRMVVYNRLLEYLKHETDR